MGVTRMGKQTGGWLDDLILHSTAVNGWRLSVALTSSNLGGLAATNGSRPLQMMRPYCNGRDSAGAGIGRAKKADAGAVSAVWYVVKTRHLTTLHVIEKAHRHFECWPMSTPNARFLETPAAVLYGQRRPARHLCVVPDEGPAPGLAE